MSATATNSLQATNVSTLSSPPKWKKSNTVEDDEWSLCEPVEFEIEPNEANLVQPKESSEKLVRRKVESQKCMRVEDRLLKAGKKYQETIKKKRVEKLVKEQENEYRLLSENIHSRYSCRSTQKMPHELPVEERLYTYSEKYKAHKEDLKYEREEAEFREMHPPQINEKSKRIVDSMNRIPKVEERLLFSGKKAKAMKEQACYRIEQEIVEQSRPFITEPSEYVSGKEVVQRLYNYQKICDLKKKIKQEQAVEESYTFTPSISEYSRRISRCQSSTSVRKPVKKANYPFRPNLNKKSRTIANKKEPSEERLLNPKKHRKHCDITVPSFRPEVDANSVRIESRSKSRGKSAERCKALYEMHKELDLKREVKKKEREEQIMKLEAEQAPFYPKLIERYEPNMSETAAAVAAMLASVEKRTKRPEVKPRHLRSASGVKNKNPVSKASQEKSAACEIGCRELIKSSKEIRDAMSSLHKELLSIPIQSNNV